MRFILSFLAALLLLSFSHTNSHWYNTASYRCKYKTTEGRLNGRYVSYYSNGKKKAEGEFDNNCRSGTWTLWNRNGQMVTQRLYSDPFRSEGLYPDSARAHRSSYVLQRDSNGCFRHLFFTENNIFAASRYWRFIGPANNPTLFTNNRLYGIMQQAVMNKRVQAFPNDSCRTPVNFSGIDTSAIRIAGFKTMEDWIIDKDRLVLEQYVIAICPVAINQTTGDTTELYWVLREDLRPSLVKEPVQNRSFPGYVENMDYLFFFHCFAGKVIRDAVFADGTHSLQKYDPENVALRTDLDIINNEHNIWLRLYK